jgi:hypothetical protein
MKRKVVLILSFLVIAFMLTGCIESLPALNTETFEQTYPFQSGMALEVYNFNGSVTITTWDSNNVQVHAEKKTNFGKSELNTAKISVEQSKNLIIKSEKLSINPRVNITYDIKVPTSMAIQDIETSNGGINLDRCNGNALLRTSNGGMNIFDYTGNIDATSSNGGLTFQKVKGNLNLSTSNGGIRVQDIQGFVRLNTSNGGIEVKGVEGISDIRTSNGKIEVEVPGLQGGGGSISTSNGSITAYISRKLNLNLDVSTSNGKINIEGLDLILSTSSDRMIKGRLGTGGDLLTITTSNANVYISNLD